jgi:hypothetical protein
LNWTDITLDSSSYPAALTLLDSIGISSPFVPTELCRADLEDSTKLESLIEFPQEVRKMVKK